MRAQSRDEFLDLPLALVPGGIEDSPMILRCQMRCQEPHRRESHPSVGKQLQEDQELPGGTGGLDPTVGRMLR